MLSIVLFLSLCQYLTAKPAPTEIYSNDIVLKEPNDFHLYWNFNDTDILFETHVKTNGWSAFGLSPTGGMDNSDVIVSWIDSSGSHHFSDRHIRGTSVLIDKIQNWNLISIFRKDGYLVTKFSRKIKICDSNEEDLDIPSGTPFVIFAYSSNFQNKDITYHGSSRGTRSVPLISSISTPIEINMKEVETNDFRVNYTFDGTDTDYHCHMFKLPDNWNDKRHLIRYETLFSPGTEENLHHWVIHECNADFEDVFLKNNSIPEPGQCFSDNWVKTYLQCGRLSLVWAVGGAVIQDFPQDLAYPLGGSDKTGKYFFIEIHYDNPKLKSNVRDFSGIRYYTTQNYRKTEFGIFTVGTGESFNGIIVPPRAERYQLDYSCSTECTDKIFEEQPEIKVFSSLPHSHLLGKEIYATVVRDGKEVDYLSNNKYYDFNYQYYNFLSKPVTLKKGDEIRTTCVYSSKDKDTFTYGGLATYHEMCFSFLWYYPRTNMIMCSEDIKTEDWVDYLNKLKKSGEIDFNYNINVSLNYFQYSENLLNLKTKNPTPELAKKFEEFHANAPRRQGCSALDQIFVSEKKFTKPIPIEDEPCSLN